MLKIHKIWKSEIMSFGVALFVFTVGFYDYLLLRIFSTLNNSPFPNVNLFNLHWSAMRRKFFS